MGCGQFFMLSENSVVR